MASGMLLWIHRNTARHGCLQLFGGYMKYLLAIKIIDTNEVEIFEFDNEFEREDAASEIMENYTGVSLGYTQDDWVIDGEQILYCYECIGSEV